jgi:hypothetical protein
MRSPSATTAAPEIVANDRPTGLATDGASQKSARGSPPKCSRCKKKPWDLACSDALRDHEGWGTLMRHAQGACSLSRSISGLSESVLLSPSSRLLIPPAGRSAALLASFPAAPLRAVAMATVTPRAQKNTHGAQIAEESSTIGAQSLGTSAWTFAPKPATIAGSGALAPGREAGDGYLPRKHRPPRSFFRGSDSPSEPEIPRAHARRG